MTITDFDKLNNKTLGILTTVRQNSFIKLEKHLKTIIEGYYYLKFSLSTLEGKGQT